ncbi:MFS transporter [Chengkuizengella axinellae]|uniref:MFS transporter n=1 Tax=Chengkuizengella axinellae TaxID=3064388 RepID=A0ABT9J3T7_9BACL|nr:MFS transporter [Chengkuizengella sp. 2205SS18-9]MDP5276264.1 MFS transporter [Chengkuizengella sp. 2205SS18-9]
MYKQVLSNKNFLYYLVGGSVSRLGDILTGLAFLFVAYDLTGSKLHTTGVVIAETLPYLFFGLLGGVIADWVNKKRLMIFIDIIRVPLILSTVVLFHFDFLNYTYLLLISFAVQTLGCFFNPSFRAMLPIIITSSEQRNIANSLYDSLTRGITVLSPIITVLLIQTVGEIHFFTLDAFTYVISVIAISMITVKTKQMNTDDKKDLKNAFRSLIEFAQWVKKQHTVRSLFLLTFVMVFLNTWLWEVGLLLSLLDMSDEGKSLFSILQGGYGAVVIITNLLIPLIWKKLSLKTYLIGSIIWGIGLVFLGFAMNIPMYFVGAAVVGIGIPITGLTRVYIIQNYIPEDMHGKGFSLNAVLLYLADTISLIIFGVLSTFVSLNLLFVVNGFAIVVIVGVIFIIRYRVYKPEKKHRMTH